MSQVPIADLPEMLTYEQMADACTVKYIDPDDVFPISKWRNLVSCAEKAKDLIPEGGMISVAAINDWLANGGVGLWSVFELHDPLLSDMNGMFEERDCTLLPTPIRERIRRIFHFSPWSALTPKERWEMVFAHDAMNTFKQRLRSCLGNLVYFGGCDGPMPGPTIHSEANRVLAEWKSVRASEAGDFSLKEIRVAEHLKWQEKLNALNELILTGCLREEDEIPRLLGIVREAQAETWCANVIFPIWTNLNNPFDDQPPAPALVESSYQANKYQADWPLCTKQEIIDGFQLTGKNWSDFLSRPNKYSEAVKQAGKKGVGGDALLSPIIFARLLVQFDDLKEGQVKARFLKVDEWKQWEDEMISEIGAI